MTTLINARPRFGLEGDRLFCYQTSRYFPTTGRLSDGLGIWNLQKVAELIRGQSTIEDAFTPAGCVRGEDLDELRSEMVALAATNDSLVKENLELVQKLVAAESEAQRLNELLRQKADQSEASKPADKVEETVQAFNEKTPPPAEGDKVEQAKQDFLANAEPDYSAPKADVEGAMAAQEAPPKGD